MTDFVRQLEAELLAAAHRRAATRRRLPRFSPRPLIAVAALAAAVAAVLTLAVRPAPEPSPPAVAPAAFTIPVADRQRPCEARGQEPTGEPAPAAVSDAIALLRTRGGVEQRLPAMMRGEGMHPFGTWLPVGSFASGSERKSLDTSKLFVLPTGDVRTGPIACGPTTSRGPGACLVSGAPVEPVSTRCFTIAEIRAGRAFTLVDVSRKGARLLGLVPDGTAQVGLASTGVFARLPVRENVVQDYVYGLKATDNVTVKLDARKPRVLVLNETTTPGLATVTADEVRKLGIDASADASPPPPTRSESVVQITQPGAELLARRVARLLGLRVESAANQRMDDPAAPDVTVRLGTDRMR